jgi:hypothetical protein
MPPTGVRRRAGCEPGTESVQASQDEQGVARSVEVLPDGGYDGSTHRHVARRTELRKALGKLPSTYGSSRTRP